MLFIISIITIVPCMHEIHQNAIKHSSLCYSLYAIQYLVDMQLFKTSLMLPGCFLIFLYGGGKGVCMVTLSVYVDLECCLLAIIYMAF